MRVYIRPQFAGPDQGEGGIRRVVEAQHRYLPYFGVEIVDSEEKADIVAVHAGDMVNTSKPLVCHNHGLYATAEQAWDAWAWSLNAFVIENLRRSDVATVPSKWVAEQVARGMCVDAEVWYAGVDPVEWDIAGNQGYVLWNKTRADPVCDPAPVAQLAQMNPNGLFVSTFGIRLPNVRLTGRLPYEEAKELIRHAAVYLCTARETFGIGTLEAMAAGVPVVGWKWGGQVDIVEQLVTGYLAEPGDYQELNQGLHLVLSQRDKMGVAAREAVFERFTWHKSMEHCADIYNRAVRAASPRVSVIVTCYNLERYLPECLDSIKRQTDGNWECIVVDDCSPGNCRAIVNRYRKEDKRFHYIKTPKNLYLAGARNYGIALARARYIMPLDADDMLGERSLKLLGDFLDENPGYAIAYGAMQVIEESKAPFVSGWPIDFHWENQMAGRNSLPYASMYRKNMWRRTGGYRERCQTSEDNDFWCRVTSFGFRAAKATNYPTLIYRQRRDSMSGSNVWPDCTVWYPWARNRQITPFGSVGSPPKPHAVSWPVQTYTSPLVSVVVPVGPGHNNIVRDALDSILAQTDDRWEAIIVNDSGKPIDLAGFPWVRRVETPEAQSGPAVARNTGVAAARGKFFVLLDADDYLMPDFIRHCLDVQSRFGGYVYTDWYEIHENGDHKIKQAAEFSVEDLLWKGLQWTVTALYPKEAWEAVGGFDKDAGGWEDWDFYFALAVQEICGTRLPEPLLCYRYYAGQRREQGYADEKANAAALKKKWREYTVRKGARLMACRGCGRGGGGRAAAPAISLPQQRQASSHGNMMLMEYIGNSQATQIILGPKTGQRYRLGGNPEHRQIYVWEADVSGLLERVPFLKLMVQDQTEERMPTEPPQVRQAKNRIITEVGG